MLMLEFFNLFIKELFVNGHIKGLCQGVCNSRLFKNLLRIHQVHMRARSFQIAARASQTAA